MSDPVAYFITFTTYGTWLRGRAPGSVDRDHNVPGTSFLPPDPDEEAVRRAGLRQPRTSSTRPGGKWFWTRSSRWPGTAGGGSGPSTSAVTTFTSS